MSLFSRHKRTPEEWYRHLLQSKEPVDLAKPLLSGRPFIDKAKILLAMPATACKNKSGMRELESMLEDARYIQLAQTVRYRAFWNHDGDRGKCLQWSQDLIEADIEARWIVQREIYVGEEFRALGKNYGTLPR